MGSLILAEERRTASFNPEFITNLLDGGPEKTERRRWLRTLIESEEVFSNADNNYMHRTERYERALAKAVRAKQLEDLHRLSEEDAIMLRACICDDLPTTLHTLMFLPSILSLFDDEQQQYWVPLARSYKVLGCYAQTEVGHGSNIRALQTRATYLPDTDEFQLNTPSLEAFKWWPGTLGRTANHALVVARLILPGNVDKGIHSFIVPLRSLSDHSLLPGVVTRDIGPKIAFNSMDNGCLELHDVRIPRRNMAMRFTRVEKGGEYTTVPGAHSKSAYITMMQVRAYIVMHCSRELSKACTIAIRYSAVRLQGYDESGVRERQVLDYTTQQHRLLPLLAGCFAFHFIGAQLLERVAHTGAALAKGQGGNELAQLHLATSGYKAVCTRIAADGIEDCRKACGGHGYLSSSGLPELSGNFLQQCTVEGDNVVLAQQAGASLLKAYARLVGGEAESLRGGECDYFETASENLERGSLSLLGRLREGKALLRVYGMRALAMLKQLAEHMHRLMTDGGLSQAQAWNKCQLDIVAVARAHTMFSLNRVFTQSLRQLQTTTDRKVLQVLDKLRALFGLYWLTQELADFLEHGVITAEEAREAREEVVLLLKELRPEAVVLVDSWDWSDEALKSVLGRKDGNVYEALLESAIKEPLNAQDPVQGYHHIMAPLRQGDTDRRARL